MCVMSGADIRTTFRVQRSASCPYYNHPTTHTPSHQTRPDSDFPGTHARTHIYIQTHTQKHCYKERALLVQAYGIHNMARFTAPSDRRKLHSPAPTRMLAENFQALSFCCECFIFVNMFAAVCVPPHKTVVELCLPENGTTVD